MEINSFFLFIHINIKIFDRISDMVILISSNQSAFPSVPGIPSVPGVPSVPGIPSVPGVPSVPGIPVPGVPGVPGIPQMPGVPAFGVFPASQFKGKIYLYKYKL